MRADTKHDQNGGGGLVSSSVRVSDLEGSKSGNVGRVTGIDSVWRNVLGSEKSLKVRDSLIRL